MGERLEFPGNSEMYLKQVTEHVKNGRLEEAHLILKKVYASDQSKKIVYLYSNVLLSLGREAEALEMVNAHKDEFLSNEVNRVHYAMLLIQNLLFIEAEALINENISDRSSALLEDWLEAQMMLELSREAFNVEVEKQKKYAKEELQNIESYTPMKQAEIVKNGRDLALHELQEIAPFLLTNPYVFSDTRSAFLEILIEKGDPTEYIVPWFNEEKALIPKETALFDRNPKVQEIEEVLANKLHKHPSLYKVIQTEIIGDLLKIYPFISEVVTDVYYWVDHYIHLFDYSQQLQIDITPKNSEQEALKKQIERLTFTRIRNQGQIFED